MEIKVFETTDYSIFKRLTGNRELKSKAKIIQSIQKVGYIPMPITVNQNMEVIDGQNRLAALEELKLPVHYYIVAGTGIEEARSLNIGRKDWNTTDYINSYAESNNENYARLMGLLNEYSKAFPLQVVLGVTLNVLLATGWAIADIKEGTLILTEEDYIKAVDKLEYLKSFRDVLNKIEGTKRLTYTVIAWCSERCDRNRLRKVISQKYPMIRPVCKTEFLLEDISDIYNKGIKNKIYFEHLYKIENE